MDASNDKNESKVSIRVRRSLKKANDLTPEGWQKRGGQGSASLPMNGVSFPRHPNGNEPNPNNPNGY